MSTLDLRLLQTMYGSLPDIFPKVDPSKIQHSHQIMAQIMADGKLQPDSQSQSRWAEYFPMYRAEDEEAVLYLAPLEHNLGFRDMKNFALQLSTKGDYATNDGIEEIVNAAKAGNALRVRLSDLRLKDYDKESKYLEIDASNVDSLNPAERALTERVFGQEFIEMLRKAGITARIYVLNPDYVKSKVKGDGAIARASRYNWSRGYVEFHADIWHITYTGNTGLCVIVREPKNVKFKHYA